PAPPIPTPVSIREPVHQEQEIYIALYDYGARAKNHLTIKKGDRMIMLYKDGAWSVVRLLQPNRMNSNTKGYVPSNFIRRESLINSQPPWMFDTAVRSEAITLLMQPCNQQGAFMVRRRADDRNEYALSVKVEVMNKAKVHHFKIKKSSQGYLMGGIEFITLDELVAFYKKNLVGDIARLGSPCKQSQMVVESPQTIGLSHDIVDEWEIDRNSIQLGKKLGSGQFGEVHKGLWNKTTTVAVKTMKSSDSLNKEEFLKEARLMKKLHHPKLVQLFAVCTQSEPFYIVTELMCNGALLDYLTGEDLNLEEEVLIDMATQVATGMAYLEVKNYIHRDLAARNILVGKNNNCKVADFGLARLTQDDEIYQAKVKAKIPIRWTAPEAITKQQFSIKSDVWSFGILLTEIIGKGRVPYPGMNNKEVLEQLERGYRMERLEKCSEDMYKIMRDCWDIDPNERPSFEILEIELSDFLQAYV
uniref:Tyrosine-protein kinase n=1 Tax=Ciona intestinalis TaxID=7719 RepID=F6RMF5_CIOIN